MDFLWVTGLSIKDFVLRKSLAIDLEIDFVSSIYFCLKWKDRLETHHISLRFFWTTQLHYFHMYSYLSNVKSRLLILKKNPTFQDYWFLRFFFHPPLLVYWSYVLVFSKRNPTLDFAYVASPPRLFQIPRLLERWNNAWL